MSYILKVRIPSFKQMILKEILRHKQMGCVSQCKEGNLLRAYFLGRTFMLSSLVSSERVLKPLTGGMLNFKQLYISASVRNSFFQALKDLPFIYFVFMVGGHMYATGYVCRSEDNIQELVLTFHQFWGLNSSCQGL